jgi:hypothetical protein
VGVWGVGEGAEDAEGAEGAEGARGARGASWGVMRSGLLWVLVLVLARDGRVLGAADCGNVPGRVDSVPLGGGGLWGRRRDFPIRRAVTHFWRAACVCSGGLVRQASHSARYLARMRGSNRPGLLPLFSSSSSLLVKPWSSATWSRDMPRAWMAC